MKNSFSGQSVFELIVALGVGVLILTSLVKIVTISVRNATYSKEQAQATRYAQEGVEWIRTERDKDWQGLLNKSQTGSSKEWCIGNLSWPAVAPGCSSNEMIANTSFSRKVELLTRSSDIIEVDVTVSWNNGGEHSSNISTRLTNWATQ